MLTDRLHHAPAYISMFLPSTTSSQAFCTMAATAAAAAMLAVRLSPSTRHWHHGPGPLAQLLTWSGGCVAVC